MVVYLTSLGATPWAGKVARIVDRHANHCRGVAGSELSATDCNQCNSGENPSECHLQHRAPSIGCCNVGQGREKPRYLPCPGAENGPVELMHQI